MIACQDDELFDWLRVANAKGGSFVQSIAFAGLAADSENYAIIRPVLLQMRAKYPDYLMLDPITLRPKPQPADGGCGGEDG